ncbi:MAG: TonB-dependent receptor [Pseudomonadota bacterium]
MKKSLSGFLSVLFLIFVPSLVFSEDVKDGIASSPVLDEVVVSATKTEEKRKDVANSVILINQTDIQESTGKSVGELLANEPGIDWRTRGDYGGASQEIHIRGMGAEGTQVLVNGIVVNSPSIGSADVGKIPLNSIEKLEVVKGSGSLLYGTSASGGIINIITKRPKKDKMDIKVSAGYGSENTYEISAEQGMFVTDDFGYYITATKRDTDGFRDNSELNHKDVSLNLVYDKGDILDISLYGDYIDRDFGQPGVDPPKGTSAFYFNGIKVYDKDSASLFGEGGDKDGHLALTIQSSPLKWLGINLKGSYMNMENYNYSRYYTTWPVPDFPGSETWVTNEVLQAEGNVDIQPIDGLKILLGGEYKEYKWKNELINLDGSGTKVYSSKSRTSEKLHTSGLFTEAQYRPCSFFKASAGVRHEDHSEFGTKYVPRYGIIINPLEGTVFKFNYGKHFNAPTPNDLFWPYEDYGPGMGGVQGNTNLKPETGEHSDVTIEQSLLDDKLFVTASYFKWDINDKIRWASDASYFYRPENLDSYKSKGFEIGSKFGPYYDITLFLNYTYTDAEEEIAGGVKRQNLYTSDHFYKCGFIYWNDSGFTMTTTYRYVGDRPGYYRNDSDKHAEVKLDSYYTVDIKLEQRLLDNWVLSLQGNNLFDEEYDTYTRNFKNQDTGITSIEGYPGAGTSVFFNVRYEY